MKKIVSLVVALVMMMSVSAIAFAAENIEVSGEPETQDPIATVAYEHCMVVEEYGDGVVFLYYTEENPSIMARAYGQQSTSYTGMIVDSGVQKYKMTVYGTFNVTSSIVTCLSRSESHNVLDGTDYTFDNPHAWHSPANGGSICWAYATVSVKKYAFGIPIKMFDFNVRVGYNTSGTRLTNQQ